MSVYCLSRPTSRARILAVCLLFPLLATIYIFSSGARWAGLPWNGDASRAGVNSQDLLNDEFCKRYPDPGNVVVSVRTGATEAMGKLPTIFTTYLRCAKRVVLFSDMEQWIQGRHIHDALDRVAPSIRETSPEFTIYRQQQELKDRNLTDMTSALRNSKDGLHTEAWTLDKYKHLHTIQRTWEEYPDVDWYVFIEADTYLSWPNLLAYLRTMNPTKVLYRGSVSLIGDFEFAHGGSGYILSKPALRDLAAGHPGIAAEWDEQLSNECCGDYAASRAFADIGVNLTNAWPVIQGESLESIPFGPDYWCRPMVTMHHILPDEIKRLFDFELTRLRPKSPLIFAELYRGLQSSNIIPSREDWDNRSDQKKIPLGSLEECRTACYKAKDCLQFSFNGEECSLHDRIRLGKHRDQEKDGRRWMSEWNIKRINKWVKSHLPCRSRVNWKD